MNNNALKILKRTSIRCPECDANGLVLIERKREVEGITYRKQYYFCECCEYEKEFKRKGDYSKLVIEDD